MQARVMCCVAALNKLRLAMMAMMKMITITMKMITQTEIEDSGDCLVQDAKGVRAKYGGYDVLLRKRA